MPKRTFVKFYVMGDGELDAKDELMHYFKDGNNLAKRFEMDSCMDCKVDMEVDGVPFTVELDRLLSYLNSTILIFFTLFFFSSVSLHVYQRFSSPTLSILQWWICTADPWRLR